MRTHVPLESVTVSVTLYFVPVEPANMCETFCPDPADASPKFQDQVDGAGWPVKNAVQKFRGELEDFIRQGMPSAAIRNGKSAGLPLVGAH